MYTLKSRRMSTQRKTMLSLLFLLLVLLLVNVFLLWISTQKLEKEKILSINKQYDNAVNQLELECDLIHSQLINFIDDVDLNTLTRLQGPRAPYDWAKLIKNIQEKLAIILRGQTLLSDLSVYIPTESLIINAKGSLNGSIRRLESSDISEINEYVLGISHRYEIWEGKLIIPVKSVNKKTNEVYYMLFAELSQDAITRDLTNSLSGIEGAKFLCYIPGCNMKIFPASSSGEASIMGDYIGKENDSSIVWNGKQYNLSKNASSQGDLVLYTMISDSTLQNIMSNDNILAIVLAILVVFVGIGYFLMDYKLVNRPLNILLEAFDKVGQNDLSFRLKSHGTNEFSQIFDRFNIMIDNLSKLIDVTEKQKQLLVREELKQLQRQTDPHFFYNSYFLLHRMIKGQDYERAVRISSELGKYLKYITRSIREFVPFHEEYEHAYIYADIQSERFGERIKVEFAEIPDSCTNILIPRWILQPLIENSFLHGLEDKEENGLLKVTFFVTKDGISIIVEDNGENLDDDRLIDLRTKLVSTSGEEITALQNIYRRLCLYYGEGTWMELCRSPLGGLRTQIKVPLRKEN